MNRRSFLQSALAAIAASPLAYSAASESHVCKHQIDCRNGGEPADSLVCCKCGKDLRSILKSDEELWIWHEGPEGTYVFTQLPMKRTGLAKMMYGEYSVDYAFRRRP